MSKKRDVEKDDGLSMKIEKKATGGSVMHRNTFRGEEAEGRGIKKGMGERKTKRRTTYQMQPALELGICPCGWLCTTETLAGPVFENRIS